MKSQSNEFAVPTSKMLYRRKRPAGIEIDSIESRLYCHETLENFTDDVGDSILISRRSPAKSTLNNGSRPSIYSDSGSSSLEEECDFLESPSSTTSMILGESLFTTIRNPYVDYLAQQWNSRNTFQRLQDQHNIDQVQERLSFGEPLVFPDHDADEVISNSNRRSSTSSEHYVPDVDMFEIELHLDESVLGQQYLTEAVGQRDSLSLSSGGEDHIVPHYEFIEE